MIQPIPKPKSGAAFGKLSVINNYTQGGRCKLRVRCACGAMLDINLSEWTVKKSCRPCETEPVDALRREYIGHSQNGAVFSSNREHRWHLWRRFEPGVPLNQMVAFIGLNPSTADEIKNDNTITRCIHYAERWGFGGLSMLNAFAFRATNPGVMKATANPIGEENDIAILTIAKQVGQVVCCWGNHAKFQDRGTQVEQLLRRAGLKLHVLKINKDGSPAHPLYLRADQQPFEWTIE